MSGIARTVHITLSKRIDMLNPRRVVTFKLISFSTRHTQIGNLETTILIRTYRLVPKAKVPPIPTAMSTCNSNCQNLSCTSQTDSSQTKLTLIFGVLDIFNGFHGVLIAILVGYLQARQFRRFNQAMNGSDDDEKAPEQPIEYDAKRAQTA
jgi:hypothetical protein